MAHLKTKVPGTLWLAVGMDGDHHLMVVGWGLCSPENKEEWKIFQQGLCQQYSMELVDPNGFFFSFQIARREAWNPLQRYLDHLA